MEEKIKLENDIISAKRELKIVSANLEAVKKECASALTIRDNTLKLIEEQKAYLEEVNASISDAQLNWAKEKNKDMDELAEKNAAADNILKLKGELNAQEETIRKEKDEAIDARNEQRRLELSNADKKIALEAQAKEIEEKKVELLKISKHDSQKRVAFKLKITNLLSEVNSL